MKPQALANTSKHYGGALPYQHINEIELIFD